jgi:putative oxidoreductase
MTMPHTDIQRGRDGVSVAGGIARIAALIATVPPSLTLLVLRIALAIPFYRSGITKWQGFLQLSDTPVFLFTDEFKLHLFGRTFGYPFPVLMAWSSSIAEIVLPVLLVIGLGTRISALMLLAMTALIQLTIPDGWANFHLPWAAMALAIMTFGPGRISADHLLHSRYRGSR